MNHTTSSKRSSVQKTTTTKTNEECCLNLILTNSGWRTIKTNSESPKQSTTITVDEHARIANRNLSRSSLFVVHRDIHPQINTRAKL